jgi:hypothetical protein
VPQPPGAAPARENVLTDGERRARELTEALEAQRHENDVLRARLHAFETRDESAQDKLRIELLERRLDKVVRSLEKTEERLARASGENAVDPGIASCYRTVQGLAADAPQRGLKVALMQQLFEGNLALLERIRSRCAQFPPTQATLGLD